MKATYRSQIVTAAIMTMLFVAFQSLFLGQVAGQTRTLKITGDQDIFLLKELGAVISDSEEGLSVLMVMPPEHRAKAYSDVDIREGDIILMMNGKSLKKTTGLEEIYNEMKIGDEIQLGIRRNKELLIVELDKADPDDLPGQVMMMKKGGSKDDLSLVMADAGLILAEIEGQVVIDEVIQGLEEKFTGGKPQKGDIMLKIQGKAISLGNEVPRIYSAIASGEQVDLILGRHDKEITVSFIKQGCGDAKPLIIEK